KSSHLMFSMVSSGIGATVWTAVLIMLLGVMDAAAKMLGVLPEDMMLELEEPTVFTRGFLACTTTLLVYGKHMYLLSCFTSHLLKIALLTLGM
ncbi:hypothetical protein DNTS_005967, partial [Danionella cerebrum]